VTRQLVDIAMETLKTQGHEVLQSDLYGMGWKAVFDDQDFPERANQGRLSFIEESGHAFLNGCQTADVEAEQGKILAADAVILLFPLWWFGMPAILKGWVDRVWAFGLAYGYRGAGNAYRYGEGGFAGKRALLADPSKTIRHVESTGRWSSCCFPSRTERCSSPACRCCPRSRCTGRFEWMATACRTK